MEASLAAQRAMKIDPVPNIEPLPDDFLMNCHVARGYDLRKLTQEIIDESNSAGTTLEQTYHYVIDKGAMGWLKQAEQEDYVAAYSSLPMEEVVDAIVHRLSKTSYDQESLDILALGCGHAREERRLIQILENNTNIRNIRLFLLDISPFLLNVAHQRTQETFGDNVLVRAIQGNFHHLQRYHSLLSTSARANRMMLITMLGGTWTNLENELLLLRSGLRPVAANSLFLLDVVQRYAPEGQTDLIRALDPRLAGTTKWRKESEAFLSTPLMAYREGIQEQKLHWEFVLDEHSLHVPNSYTVEVRLHLEPNVQFTVRKYKRYQQEGLRDAFEKERWKLYRTFPFKGNRLACLFQKH